ncbi:hypothetical protein MMC09_006015 [Bachmanniomyces sp. S44760]|nr:hypothetical protein [Bachmanniomyces sp. S44760]
MTFIRFVLKSTITLMLLAAHVLSTALPELPQFDTTGPVSMEAPTPIALRQVPPTPVAPAPLPPPPPPPPPPPITVLSAWLASSTNNESAAALIQGAGPPVYCQGQIDIPFLAAFVPNGGFPLNCSDPSVISSLEQSQVDPRFGYTFHFNAP